MKAFGPIRHDALPLSRPDLGTQIRLWRLTKDALCLATLGRVARNHVVSWLHTRDTLTDRLDNAPCLVSENARKESFRVHPIKSVHVSAAEP